MPKKFVLSAQLSLLPPSTAQLNSILSTINSKLKGANVSVNVNIPQNVQKQLNQLNGAFKSVKNSANSATSELENFGKQSALAIRRFAAFSIATGGFIALGVAIKHSFSEAIKFDREMVRIAQVTGKSLDGLKDLSDEITRLATGFGVSSSKIANVAVTLSQAGISANDTKKALEVLAKTELSATFDNIKDTTEGAIAIMAQFGDSVNDLERDLGAINTVAAKFAVESSDIITTVRRTGGAFKSAGGSLNELIALFTSVRSTTRESAESIATGFRTIFTRIQRPKTVEFLRDLGIELRDLKGQFVGPYEAVSRLSEALKDLPTTDPRFAKIIEELGGFRQVSKVIPLIQQFEISQKALSTAQRSGNSITEDAATAQQALSVQLAKVREEFDALFRKVANNSGIRAFIDLSLKLASSFIKLADSLTPLLPLLLTFGAVKGAGALATIGKGFGPALVGRKHNGGPIGFAGGGFVPGTGNSDSVRANLTPGEFVLRKSAVKKLGADNVAKLNKYADGGTVDFGIAGLLGQKSENTYPIQVGKDTFHAHIISSVVDKLQGATLEKKTVRPAVFGAALESAKILGSTIGAKVNTADAVKSMRKLDLNSVSGQIFEAALGSLGAPYDEGAATQDALDFPHGIGKLTSLFGNDKLAAIPTDAKRRIDNAVVRQFKDTKAKRYIQGLAAFGGAPGETLGMKDIKSKLVGAGLLSSKEAETFKSESILNRFSASTKQHKFGFLAGPGNTFTRTGVQHKASGGGVDTVPAMLTPGEFVINKESAKRIGMGTLNKINRFAKGGAVGKIGEFAKNNPGEALLVSSQLSGVFGSLTNFGDAINKITQPLSTMAGSFIALKAVIGQFSKFDGPRQEVKELTKAFHGLTKDIADNAAKQRNVAQGLKNLDVIEARNGRLTPQQSKARGFLEGTQANLQNQETSLFSRRNAVDANRRGIARSIKIGGAINAIAPFVGAIGGEAGSFLSNAGAQRITATGGASGKGLSVAGGALSGAAAGASFGALLTPILGPLGIVGGALIGATHGFITSLNEADKAIRELHFAKDLEEVSNISKRVSTNQVKPGKGADELLSLTRKLEEHKNSAITSEEAKNAKSDIESQLPTIEQTIKKLAETGDESETFKRKLNLLAEFFDRANGSGNAFKKALIESTIRQKNLNKALADSQKLQAAESRRLLGIRNISASFGDLNTELDVLTHSLDTTSTQFIDISNIFSRLGETANSSRFNLAANSVGEFLGPLGKELASKLTTSNEIGKILPDIVKRAATSTISGTDVDFKSVVERELSERFTGPFADEVRQSILNQIEQLAGGTGEDTKLRLEGHTDPISLAKKLLNGMEEYQKIFASASQTLTRANNQILTAFQNRAQLEEKLTQGLTHIVDIREAALHSTAAFQERNVTAQEVSQADRARQNILFDSAGVGGFAEARARIQQVGQRIQEQKDLQNQGQVVNPDLVNDLNGEFERLQKVMDFFANATQRAAALENALNNARDNRKSKRSVIEGLAFGSLQSRVQNQQIFRNSAIAAGSGTLKGFSSQQAKEILDFISGFQGGKIFGQDANKLRDKLSASVAGGAFLQPGAEEQAIQKEKDRIFREGKEAQESLNKLTDAGIKKQTELVEAIRELVEVEREKLVREGKAAVGAATAEDDRARLGIRSPVEKEIAIRDATRKKEEDKRKEDAARARGLAEIAAARKKEADEKAAVDAGIRAAHAGRGGGFATGGTIPGTGSGDTVPAMLTPGEFVINKASAEAIGYDNLHQLNHYADGGYVSGRLATRADIIADQVQNPYTKFNRASGSFITTERGKALASTDRSSLSLPKETVKQYEARQSAEAALEAQSQEAYDKAQKAFKSYTTFKPANPSPLTGKIPTGSALRGSDSYGFKSGDYAQPVIPTVKPNPTRAEAAESRAYDKYGIINSGNSGKGGSERAKAAMERAKAAIKNANEGIFGNTPLNPKAKGSGVNGGRFHESPLDVDRRNFARPRQIVADSQKTLNGRANYLSRRVQRAQSRQKFATGGLVGGGGGAGMNLDGFNAAVTAFSNTASNLANSLNAFPRSIELSAHHTVEVIFNGAEVMSRLLPQIQEIAVSKANEAINNMIKTKMPDVGTV